MTDLVVQTDALTVEFGAHRALDELSVSVRGGITGLVGANGAGKTTLFNVLLGLVSPSGGQARVAGLDPVADGPAVRARIGFSPERNVLPDDMAADEFVRHLAEVRGLPRREARGRASDALWLVGLGEERFRPLGTMSTGQRQRVKLAQAVACDPAVMILDEPTDGLDPVQRDEMLGLIATINREFGIDVLISSHVLEEVERVCHDVVIVDTGRLVVAGAIGELVASTGDRVELELVSVRDRPGAVDAVVERLVANGLDVTRSGSVLLIAARSSSPDRSSPDHDDTHGSSKGSPDWMNLTLDAVTAACAATGARIARMGERRTTLEDVYLATGHRGES